jgi:CMP-N,N'-diacetyllegionaminic acid synthase
MSPSELTAQPKQDSNNHGLPDGVVVAVVPARGGSKGIPAKNLRILGGQTLLQRSIECAQSVDCVDEVVVSTDSADIASHAESCGAKVVRRPPELATDDSLVKDAIRHARDQLVVSGVKLRAMVLLEPTSPLRQPDDVARCVTLLIEKELDSVATFTTASLNPQRAWRLTDGTPEPFIEGAVPWMRRQDLPSAYELNGAVYAFRPDLLDSDGPGLLAGRMAGVVMPKERSIDIDDEFDLVVAQLLLERDTL